MKSRVFDNAIPFISCTQSPKTRLGPRPELNKRRLGQNGAPTIECKNVTKSFGEGDTVVHTLRDITFTAYASQMIMLMGPSGSGKSTLLSIIGGILRQDSGECLVLGQSINTIPYNEQVTFRGKNIGYIFQNFMLVPTLNAVENAAIPLMLNGSSQEDACKESDRMLLSLGLDTQRYRSPTNLSGGEQQRVAIVRACIHEPTIILCDEPTSSLDHERGKKVMEILRTIKEERNCTIIVVTHDARIMEFADRVLEIDDGVIKKES